MAQPVADLPLGQEGQSSSPAAWLRLRLRLLLDRLLMASPAERGWSEEITHPAAARNDLASVVLAAGWGPRRLLAALESPGVEQRRWRRG